MKTRIPSRRLWLGHSAAVVVSAAVGWGRTAWATPLAPTPSQTEGPFYPVSLPPDHDADLLRNGSLVYRRGAVLDLQGVVRDVAGVPVAGAEIEIWQCDEQGHYHHPGDGGRADPAFQGFGRATVGRDGAYRFRTIRPVAYSSRTPHIHVKVRLGRHELLTTQMYVDGDPGNERDPLWRRLNAVQRQALTVPLTRQAEGWLGRFPLVVQV